MLFLTITFIISISSIFILYFISRKKIKILHYIKESCNIDSVRFEKRLKFFILSISRTIKSIVEYIILIHENINKYKNRLLNLIKKIIRKKLFVNNKRENISEYISGIKE